MGQSDEPGHTVAQQQFDRLKGPLYRYALTLLRRPDLAEDAVQETFLRLWREGKSADNGHVPTNGQASAWLFRVCRNWAFDVLRKDARMSTIAENEPVEAGAESNPVLFVEQTDQLARVRQLLAELPDNQQEVVRLRFDGSLSYRQIADVTGLSVNHVGVLIHEAMKTLRERLGAPSP